MILRLLFACLAVAAVSGPVAAADPPVGRLFFTPGQRASLDIARSQRTRDTLATERTEQLVVEQPIPQTITYGGMVRRSDGQTTVWINDRAVDGGEAAGGVTIVRRVGPDGAVTLEVPQSNRRVDLKVGQSVEVLSGSVGDNYRRPTTGASDKPPAAAADVKSPDKSNVQTGPQNSPERQRSQAGEPADSQEAAAVPGSR
jgi:hypothetical protein